MADQNVTIAPGNVATLSVRLDGGATIQNQSDSSAVWVSASPGVAPGVGTRVGPKGSIQWTTGGSPCYAVTDSGVSTPVSMTLSTDVAMPVNPIDIGTAVATQLLAKGVPNVLLTEEIPFAGGSALVDVSRYASITVRVMVNTPGHFGVEFHTDQSGWELMGNHSFVAAETGYLFFTVDVIGPYMSVWGTGSNLSLVKLYGSNRQLGTKMLNCSTGLLTAHTAAYVNNQTTQLPGEIITNGGLHTIRLAVTGTGKGFLQLTSYDEYTGTLREFPLIATTRGVASPSGTAGITECLETVILPRGKLSFTFISYLTATFQVVLEVLPAQPS